MKSVSFLRNSPWGRKRDAKSRLSPESKNAPVYSYVPGDDSSRASFFELDPFSSSAAPVPVTTHQTASGGLPSSADPALVEPRRMSALRRGATVTVTTTAAHATTASAHRASLPREDVKPVMASPTREDDAGSVYSRRSSRASTSHGHVNRLSSQSRSSDRQSNVYLDGASPLQDYSGSPFQENPGASLITMSPDATHVRSLSAALKAKRSMPELTMWQIELEDVQEELESCTLDDTHREVKTQRRRMTVGHEQSMLRRNRSGSIPSVRTSHDPTLSAAGGDIVASELSTHHHRTSARLDMPSLLPYLRDGSSNSSCSTLTHELTPSSSNRSSDSWIDLEGEETLFPLSLFPTPPPLTISVTSSRLRSNSYSTRPSPNASTPETSPLRTPLTPRFPSAADLKSYNHPRQQPLTSPLKENSSAAAAAAPRSGFPTHIQPPLRAIASASNLISGKPHTPAAARSHRATASDLSSGRSMNPMVLNNARRTPLSSLDMSSDECAESEYYVRYDTDVEPAPKGSIEIQWGYAV